jgi:hypothetical protein
MTKIKNKENRLNIKQIAYQLKLTLFLFTKMRYHYRVEIDEYNPATWDDDKALKFRFFHEFAEAQQFIREYPTCDYYLIRMYGQQRIGWPLCNIDTAAPADRDDLEGIQIEVDPFGFDLPVKLSAGWYYRGDNAHHPLWVAVTKDIERMGKEIEYRYSTNKDPFKFLRNIVDDVFNERHPDAPKHFRKNFSYYMASVINKEIQNKSAGK